MKNQHYVCKKNSSSSHQAKSPNTLEQNPSSSNSSKPSNTPQPPVTQSKDAPINTPTTNEDKSQAHHTQDQAPPIPLKFPIHQIRLKMP